MAAPLLDFIEQMGLTAERNGMPRIAGRLIGLLLVEEEARSLDELADRLQVSKASISTNARLLEAAGLVERVAHPGDRRDFYRIGESPWERMFDLARQRLQETKRLFETTAASLPEEYASARARITAWSDFYAFLLDDLDRKVARWHEQHAT